MTNNNDPNFFNLFSVEYAAGATSKCNKCKCENENNKEKISKGELKVGINGKVRTYNFILFLTSDLGRFALVEISCFSFYLYK